MAADRGSLTLISRAESQWHSSQTGHMGLSENSVPLNPMVLLIIIPIKWLFHWEYTLFSDKPISVNTLRHDRKPAGDLGPV